MKDMQWVRANEKVKRVSTLVGNGLALFIAAVARWSRDGFDATVGLWLLLAGGIMLLSVQFNELLEPEDEA